MELVINQDAANQNCCGVQKYVGSVRIDLQELDRQFPHMFQVEHVTLHQLDAGVHRGRVHDRRELLGVARDRLHAGHEAEDVPLPTAAPNIALVVGCTSTPTCTRSPTSASPTSSPSSRTLSANSTKCLNTTKRSWPLSSHTRVINKHLLTNCLKKFFITQPCLSTRQLFSTPVQSLIRRMRQGNFQP